MPRRSSGTRDTLETAIRNWRHVGFIAFEARPQAQVILKSFVSKDFTHTLQAALICGLHFGAQILFGYLATRKSQHDLHALFTRCFARRVEL